MVAELVAENKTLTNIKNICRGALDQKIILPLSKIFVTDPYGYSRETGAYSIPHKGVDYRAAIGTPVMAINRGIVRVTQNYSDYGNTIVIDHGLGVMSFYCIFQNQCQSRQLVQQGQVIALSRRHRLHAGVPSASQCAHRWNFNRPCQIFRAVSMNLSGKKL